MYSSSAPNHREAAPNQKSGALKWFAIFATFVSLVILIWTAHTTNVWDDETNGFFLSVQPLGKVMELMAGNLHEDPPLYDVILHAWIKVAGYDPLALRAMSIAWWLLALWGIYHAGSLIGGRKAGYMALLVTVLMPYHWMFPAALRWYSLFAALSIWNLVFLIKWMATDASFSNHSGRMALIGYSLTGAAMWYTNYGAPAFFGAHLVAYFPQVWREKPKFVGLVLGWFCIGLFYLPWLPVFFRQMKVSSHAFSLTDMIASLYVLWAGELSTPFDWWISIPVGVGAIVAAWAMMVGFNQTRLPLTVFTLVLLLLIVKGVIWTKRMLLVSPFLALAIGLALISGSKTQRASLRYLSWVIGFSSLILSLGSLVHLYKRDGWMSYRWLMPVSEVVKQVERENSGAIILTNSNCVAFAAHDPVGISTVNLSPEKVTEMKVLPFYPEMPRRFIEELNKRLTSSKQAVYIHESSGARYSSIENELIKTLESLGYKKQRTAYHAQASASYLRFHPGYGEGTSPADSSRLIVTYFSR